MIDLVFEFEKPGRKGAIDRAIATGEIKRPSRMVSEYEVFLIRIVDKYEAAGHV